MFGHAKRATVVIYDSRIASVGGWIRWYWWYCCKWRYRFGLIIDEVLGEIVDNKQVINPFGVKWQAHIRVHA